MSEGDTADYEEPVGRGIRWYEGTPDHEGLAKGRTNTSREMCIISRMRLAREVWGRRKKESTVWVWLRIPA